MGLTLENDDAAPASTLQIAIVARGGDRFHLSAEGAELVIGFDNVDGVEVRLSGRDLVDVLHLLGFKARE